MIIILIGKSACGKDTILNEMCKIGWERIVSTTTRPMRENEVDGVDYNFTSKEEFLKSLKNGGFVETRSYNTLVAGKPDTWYYGAPKVKLSSEKDHIVVVDTQGSMDFINNYGRENCFIVSVEVPDNIREERAMKRGSFDKTEWDRRLEDDTVKFSNEIVDSVANYHIANLGNLDETVYSIIDASSAYKGTNRQAGEQYVVFSEMMGDGCYEPQDEVFSVYKR